MQRLFVRSRLAAGMNIELDRGQTNYIANVLRMEAGAPILLFNGEDGEWQAEVGERNRRAAVTLAVVEQTRPQPPPYDLVYMFAPLKHARLDYLVEKAVEMGVGRLMPVTTQHTQVHHLNLDRLAANAIEAAEQTGILTVPPIAPPADIGDVIDGWQAKEGGRTILFCDEGSPVANPLAVLQGLKTGPLAVLVGPEGGFSDSERRFLRSKPFVTTLSLGPRILRADTAAVAALALVQAALGDWRG
ncbi:MAG: 16S rRNA (uracil(1498)-N(3))-methyltransferase [Bauldia sp.]